MKFITSVFLILFVITQNTYAQKVDTIIARYSLGQSVLFYVASGEYYEGQHDIIDGNGTFLLLNAEDSLLLDIKEIFRRAKASIIVTDMEYALRPQNIEIRDIDKGCRNNMGPEVLCRLSGPSDDPELIILGFDRDGNFRRLFDHWGVLVDTKVIASDKVEITLITRANTFWYMLYRQSFIFNTRTKEIYKVPQVFVEPSYDYPGFPMVEDCIRNFDIFCTRWCPVYLDPKSAIQKESSACIGGLRRGWKVTFDKFYWAEGPGAVLVKSDSLSGWVNQNDITTERFKLPLAD